MNDAGHAGLYLRLTGVAALWGGTFVAGRIAAPVLPHFTLAALRFWVGFAILAVVLRVAEGGWPRLRRRDLISTGLLAATGLVAYNLFFLGALERIPASRTALVVALNPIMTALAMALVFRESLPLHRWCGIVLALCGVALVLSRGEPAALLQRVGAGEWLMFGGALSWAAYTIIGRYALAGPDAPSPLATTTLSALWGAGLLTLGAPAEWADWRLADLGPAVVGSILYLGAGGTALAFVWYARGVKTLGPARTAVFNNLVPVFGVLAGTLLLDERLEPSLLAGGVVAVAGVSLTNWGGRRARQRSDA